MTCFVDKGSDYYKGNGGWRTAHGSQCPKPDSLALRHNYSAVGGMFNFRKAAPKLASVARLYPNRSRDLRIFLFAIL